MKKTILTSLLSTFIVIASFAQNNQTKKHYNLIASVAVQGYDLVAYFKQGEAIKGKKELSTNVNGVVYYFYSQTNKDLFLKNALTYMPVYGGWCAYAMGKNNEKVDIDPKSFKIINEKLYLFYNGIFANTIKSWNKDQANLMHKADVNWAKIIN